VLHLLHTSANQHTLTASAVYGCSFGVKHYEQSRRMDSNK
jgi:hypothetical protein